MRQDEGPFVFVHGTYGSGDNIAHVASLFGSNGYCQDRFVAVEYDSIVTLTDTSAAPIDKIDAAIDAILAKTGADKVELAGHSQGTLHATSYLKGRAFCEPVIRRTQQRSLTTSTSRARTPC